MKLVKNQNAPASKPAGQHDHAGHAPAPTPASQRWSRPRGAPMNAKQFIDASANAAAGAGGVSDPRRPLAWSHGADANAVARRREHAG